MLTTECKKNIKQMVTTYKQTCDCQLLLLSIISTQNVDKITTKYKNATRNNTKMHNAICNMQLPITTLVNNLDTKCLQQLTKYHQMQN